MHFIGVDACIRAPRQDAADLDEIFFKFCMVPCQNIHMFDSEMLSFLIKCLHLVQLEGLEVTVIN